MKYYPIVYSHVVQRSTIEGSMCSVEILIFHRTVLKTITAEVDNNNIPEESNKKGQNKYYYLLNSCRVTKVKFDIMMVTNYGLKL